MKCAKGKITAGAGVTDVIAPADLLFAALPVCASAMEKPMKMRRIPGETLRKDLKQGAVPPLATLIRVGFRMLIASALYLYGLHHAALIVTVMSAMMLIGAVESQAAKAVAKAIPRARLYFGQRLSNR